MSHKNRKLAHRVVDEVESGEGGQHQSSGKKRQLVRGKERHFVGEFWKLQRGLGRKH